MKCIQKDENQTAKTVEAGGKEMAPAWSGNSI